MKLLMFLILVCGMQFANADFIWPTAFVLVKWHSLPVILAGLLIEIGFVKYFTKIQWKRAVVVATAMNAASAILGTIVSSAIGLFMMALLMVFAELICSIFEWLNNILIKFMPILANIPDFDLAAFDFWLVGYICAIFINISIEGEVLENMLKLSLSKNFRWLFFANAISIGICMYAIVCKLLPLSVAIGIPLLVMGTYSTYLILLYIKSKIKKRTN